MTSLTTFIRGLSSRAEFCIVVVAAFGYPIMLNIASVFDESAEPAISDADLRSLLAEELIVLSVIGLLLYVRGWRISRFGKSLRISDFAIAVALFVGTYILYTAAALTIEWIDRKTIEDVMSVRLVNDDISLLSLVAISIVNPVFEELLLCGYIVTTLKEPRGFWTAVNVSVATRLLCHLYQGGLALLFIVPLGFLFTYFYARTGRLWPLIIAHALTDASGLWPHLAQ